MLRNFIVELFENIEPFLHVFDISQSKILSVRKISFKSLNILFDKINLDDDDDCKKYSCIKSLSEFCLFTFKFEF